MKQKLSSEKLAVIGLGYVGLPVAVALASEFDDVVGFDVSARRVEALRGGHDWTDEIVDAELAASTLAITGDADALGDRTFFIVTVPTPIDENLKPDLSPVRSACALVGARLTRGSVVVFESTVYPGVTDDVCAPILEEASGLKRGVDFFLGYSPERINPGDKEHRLHNITKIIAAEDDATLARLRTVYGSVVEAGLFEASSIKVAEAAKVIENTQRDLNIALMNELALILDRMGVSTSEVLAAAGTKWNFLRFTPGLVGGHCIGVDPYYLTHASQALGYEPQVILAGRRVNNGMGAFVAERVLGMLADDAERGAAPRIGILGLTFKENVPDLRNSKVPDIVQTLRAAGAEIVIGDPLADPHEAIEEYGLELTDPAGWRDLDAIIFAVSHASYVRDTALLVQSVKGCGVVADVRSMVDRSALPPGIRYWAL